MADGKLYIIVTDKMPNQPDSPMPNSDIDGNKKDDKENPLIKYAQHRFFNFIENEAKQIVSYTVNNIGNFTGDYQAQRNINAAINHVNKLMNIGNAAVSGFVMSGGNPVGALIGTTLAIAAEGVNMGMEALSLWVQENKNNRTIARLQERSGLSGLTNGSRGTEN